MTTESSSSLKIEDIVRLLGSSGMPMTSESWAELSSNAALVAARLRELEGKNKAVESAQSSISHSLLTSKCSKTNVQKDQVLSHMARTCLDMVILRIRISARPSGRPSG